MATAIDLRKLLLDGPRNCWLALNTDQSEIVGRGETIEAAVDEAQKKGIQEPVIIWAPKVWATSVY